MTVDASLVTSNVATLDGGGFYSRGALVVQDTMFVGNAANSDGFGAGENRGFGGALFQFQGSLTMSGSALAANTANRGGGLAIWSSAVVITNSTVSGNSANGNNSPHGGGIYVYPQSPPVGSLYVSQSTITNNSAENGFGGGIYHSGATTRFKGSIVIGNISSHEEVDDCGNPVATYGYNLGSADNCGFTAGSDLEPNAQVLGPLTDNGGPTWTHALVPGSQAIDRGSCTDAVEAPVTVDQRGIARPQGAACDIGAFEKRNTLQITGGNPQTAWTGSAFCTPLQVTLGSDDPAGYATPAGIPLTFTPPTGGAGLSVVAPFVADTAAGGAASSSVTANSGAGAYQVVVTAAGVAVPAVFNLRNAAGLVAAIVASSSGGASVTLPYVAGVDYHLWRSAIPYLAPNSPDITEVIGACTNDGSTETCVDGEPLPGQGGSWYYEVRGSTGCGAPARSNATGRFGFKLTAQ